MPSLQCRFIPGVVLLIPLLSFASVAVARCAEPWEATALPPTALPASELGTRRARALERLQAAGGSRACLLLRAEPEARFAGDVTYPYRPDNDIYYLSGIAEPRCALLLSVEPVAELGRAVLFFTPRPAHERLWVGETPSLEDVARSSGIEPGSIRRLSELPAILAKAVATGRPRPFGTAGPSTRPVLYFDTGAGFEPGEALSEPYSFLLASLGSAAFQLEHRRPGSVTFPLRQRKSPVEMALLEKAVDATCRAQLAAWRRLRPGIREYEIRSILEGSFIEEGCSGWSFPPIIGTGPNACILHYQRYERQTQDGDLVLMDIGAEYGYYAADITRTVPVSGRFSPRQRAVYEAVLDAQEAAIREVRPGLPFHRVDQVARERIAASLVTLGLVEAEVSPDAVHRYLPHGISHGVGLDVHDPIASGVLEAGMVITVEPGIYIADEAIGVRIEDEVLVTEEGCRVLSASLPRSVEEIEAIIGGREF